MVDKVRTMLGNTDIDVNSLNSDGLTSLDIAVLMNNGQMAKLLLHHGALPGAQAADNLGNYLNSLIYDAELKLHHLAMFSEHSMQQNIYSRASFSSIIGSTSQSCTGTETERQMGVWERRIRGLRRLMQGWHCIETADPPISFSIGMLRAKTFGNIVVIKILHLCRRHWNQLGYAENLRANIKLYMYKVQG